MIVSSHVGRYVNLRKDRWAYVQAKISHLYQIYSKHWGSRLTQVIEWIRKFSPAHFLKITVLMVSDTKRLIFQIKDIRKELTQLHRLMAGLIIWDMKKLVTAVSQAEPWMWLSQRGPDKSSGQKGGTSILLLSLFPYTQLAQKSKEGSWFCYSTLFKIKRNKV